MVKKLERGIRALAAMQGSSAEGGYEALQSMLKGEYTEESTGARTIRQTGGKDRHSKVFTARGPRDRRVRLSVATAIRFYDLQDRLGFEQPSKAVEWLLLHCQPSIQALPQLASLHPNMRAATLSQPAYIDNHPHDHHDKEQESCHDEHITDHKEVKSYIDAAILHQSRQLHHQYKYPTLPHHLSLHDSSAPLYIADNHVQVSLEDDPPQFSNPSSSGASSDHPIFLSEVAQPHCTDHVSTLAEPIPITAPSSTAGAPQNSSPFAAAVTFEMSKRHSMQHRLQNRDDHAAFPSISGTIAANMSLSAGRSPGMGHGLSSSVNYASLCNTASFNSLMINDANAVLINDHLQGQVNQTMQPTMRLPYAACKPSQYADVTQLLLPAQASHLALIDDHHGMQGASNQATMRAAEINGHAYIPNRMNNTIQFYNKVSLQQVDELVCSNMYASPSSSESTSINTLAAAAYSKAAGNNTILVDDQAANILYRSSWNPSSGL